MSGATNIDVRKKSELILCILVRGNIVAVQNKTKVNNQMAQEKGNKSDSEALILFCS